MAPLISNFMLATKDGKKAWVEPGIDPVAPDGYRFETKSGLLSKADEERLAKGTKSAKAQAFVCLLTGSPIERGYIQAEGKADPTAVAYLLQFLVFPTATGVLKRNVTVTKHSRNMALPKIHH